jgi:hypothetical protein
MDDIKFNKAAFNRLMDETKTEGIRRGFMLAIDALRNQEFIKSFDLDRLESEICAEALFTDRDKWLNG